MSGSMGSFPGIDELRRRFAVWSLAIFGSLSGSGNVQLESSAWGAQEPQTENKTQSEKKTDDKDEAPAFDRGVFQELIQAKNFEAAGKMIDAKIANDPGAVDLYLNFTLANAMLNASEPAGLARMESVAKLSSEALSSNSGAAVAMRQAFVMSHQSLAAKLASEKQVDQAIDLLKGAYKKLEDQQAGALAAPLTSMMVSLLVREGRIDEAKTMASQRLESALAAVKENSTASSRSALGLAFSQFSSTLGGKFPEEIQKAYETIEPMLRAAVESDAGTLADYSAYQSVQTSQAMATADTDGAAAMKLLADTKALADKLGERLDDGEKKRLEAAQLSLRSMESRIKSKLLHQTLVGQPAPEFDIEAVVNMPKVNWADLKGKVVLIDFWAVWCGPCIATFPHLQTWKKEYGDKGLVIVGVTRQYGYKWDKEKNKQVTDKEATLEDELEMLEEFRKAHELEHGFVVTPKSSDYSSKFGVTGIPQAVLVDQNGVIQLIRVGSGEKNAEDMEAKIKSLLGV